MTITLTIADYNALLRLAHAEARATGDTALYSRLVTAAGATSRICLYPHCTTVFCPGCDDGPAGEGAEP